MSLQADLIESSFTLVAPYSGDLVDRFYERLFIAAPQFRAMFPANLQEQKKKLLASLALIVRNARGPERLIEPLRQMGVRHAGYGVKDEHYSIVGKVLLATLAEFGGAKWNKQYADAWSQAYDLISEIMTSAAADAARKAA